jgi:predicted cytidylate kinase
MKITISGMPGSGKSTVGRMVAERLGCEYLNTGSIIRSVAEKKGISLVEANRAAETNKSFDREIDDYQKKLGAEKESFVLEGRLGFLFIPDSVKVYLKCLEKTAAERLTRSVLGGDASRKKEGLSGNPEEVLGQIRERRASEKKRYRELYGVDYEDESNYDVVIDTTNMPPVEVCDRIIGFAKRKERITKGEIKKGRNRI